MTEVFLLLFLFFYMNLHGSFNSALKNGWKLPEMPKALVFKIHKFIVNATFGVPK